MDVAKVTSKGQITIPISIRRKLEINEGDKVLFIYKPEGVMMVNPAMMQGGLSEDVVDSAAAKHAAEAALSVRSSKTEKKPTVTSAAKAVPITETPTATTLTDKVPATTPITTTPITVSPKVASPAAKVPATTAPATESPASASPVAASTSTVRIVAKSDKSPKATESAPAAEATPQSPAATSAQSKRTPPSADDLDLNTLLDDLRSIGSNISKL